ncbi:MAG TPA: 3-isopropylmalate dehydratase small subunit [bacterium]|nr:3-isopropylmalate dehydratase small subunit [bacterium]
MLKGKAFKFGDDVDTDAIIPARYLTTTDPKELASHCMEDSTDPDFIKRVQPGDIMVAGRNFGCGSSREHAPRAIKAAGVSCVIAETFARIFFRNSINIGLPILECAEAARAIKAGDTVSISLQEGVILDETTGKQFAAEPFPEFMQKIVDKGGLMAVAQEMIKDGR